MYVYIFQQPTNEKGGLNAPSTNSPTHMPGEDEPQEEVIILSTIFPSHFVPISMTVCTAQIYAALLLAISLLVL